MNRKKVPLKFMQPITRVHNIFRIRKVVNAVTKMNLKKKFPSDEEIGAVLAQTGLSKFRKEKAKDRIMRRARDHLLTAAYMGLLTRIGRPFGYLSTSAGHLLQSYTRDEECPKDALEEAIFIDKIMRLKLTNVYDLQYLGQYADLRSRPCLYILHILKSKHWLHEHQIAVAEGGQKCDPINTNSTTSKVLRLVSRYRKINKKNLSRFYQDFRIRNKDRRNMTRNVRPLLDWCESLGLLQSKVLAGVGGRLYNLTDRGKKVLNLYGEKIPIWFSDLGTVSSAKAAILLFYEFISIQGLHIKEKFLTHRLRIGLTRPKLLELVKEIEDQLGIQFSENYKKLESELDFTFHYDVPPKNKKEVLEFLEILARLCNIKVEEMIRKLEKESIDKLKFLLEEEHQAIKAVVTGTFSLRTAISEEPVLTRVPDLIPSVGVLSQYRSDFEKEVAILFRLLDLNAVKYQGQFADRCRKTHIMKFFENNPDILVINGIESLIECKSSGEWRSPLSSDKRVPKELFIYQQYMPEVKSNSIVLVYEGALDRDSKKFITSILKDTRDLVFVTKNYLINCIHKIVLRERLFRVVKEPRKFNVGSRILTAR